MPHPSDAPQTVVAGLITNSPIYNSVSESVARGGNLYLLILLFLAPAVIGAEGLAQKLPPMQVAAASDGSAAASVDLSDPTKFPFSSTGKWKGYLDFLGKPGTERSLGQPDLFLPLLQNKNNMTFFNLRGQLQFDNTDVSEYNIGLGHRHMFKDWILGGYGYYDKRHTQFGNSYNQFTGGFEALSVDWAARVNGYLPENKTETITSGANVSVIRPGDQILVQIGGIVQERALPGIDGEVGYLLPIPWKETYELRVYAGGYHFFGEDNFESVTGPRGRVEWRSYDLPILGPGSRFMMGVEAQWDEPRGSQAFGLASLRIPFDVFDDKSTRKGLKGLDRRMLQPVIRDVDVVTSERNVTETTAALNWQGMAFTSAQNIQEAEALGDAILETANEGEVPLLIAEGSGTQSESPDAWENVGEMNLGENQTLTNAGRVLMVGYQSRYLGAGSIGYTPAGTPVVFNGRINMSPGSHLNAMTVDATGESRGISITGGGNHYVSNTTVANANADGGVGLYVYGSQLKAENLTVSDNGGTFEEDWDYGEPEANNGDNGIEVRHGSVVSFQNLTVTNNAKHGIWVHNSAVTFSGETIIRKRTTSDFETTRPGWHSRKGILAFASDLTFNGGTTTIIGKEAPGEINDIDETDSQIAHIIHSHGISARDSSTVTFNGGRLNIEQHGGDGLHLLNSSADFNRTTTTISNSFRGIRLEANSNLKFTGTTTTIKDNEKQGLLLTSQMEFSPNVTFTDSVTMIRFNGWRGIESNASGLGAPSPATITLNDSTMTIEENGGKRVVSGDGLFAGDDLDITLNNSTMIVDGNFGFGAYAGRNATLRFFSGLPEMDLGDYGCFDGPLNANDGKIFGPSGESLCQSP